MFGWSCRNLDFIAIVVCSSAVDGSHSFAVGINRNFKLVYCKCGNIYKVFGNSYSTWVVGVAVVPRNKVVVFGWSCRNLNYFTIIVCSAAAYVSPSVVCRSNHNRMLVDCKFGSVACVVGYCNCTWILYVTVAPLYKVVMFGWSCRNLDFITIIVSSATSGCSHCFVVGVNRNGELVDCKYCGICFRIGNGYRTRIVSVSVVPRNEVVVFGWSSRDGNLCSCIKSAATCCCAECIVV